MNTSWIKFTKCDFRSNINGRAVSLGMARQAVFLVTGLLTAIVFSF